MVTLSPPLHPASLDMGTAADPLGECAAEAVQLAVAALIHMHGAGHAGNAVDPSQRCLSPNIFQDDVTQVSEACYDGDPTLSAAQELYDASWDSLIPPDTPFGLTDFIPDGVCSDMASSVSNICLCNDGCDACLCNDGCDICLRSGGCDDTVSQGACWEQSIDFTDFTPPDVCLAEQTLDLDLVMEPLDATSLEEAFAELGAERRPAQASSSSASPTLPVSAPATSAERAAPRCRCRHRRQRLKQDDRYRPREDDRYRLKQDDRYRHREDLARHGSTTKPQC
ncbi:hypothetical protein VDGE_30777 [Verticillium dahliae]|uniref:Uncharacterized protein n=1 Tax=Verticillium dahliae TaxID=27337 RepID=A0A444RJ17_VERDA|nr:hypothetical protein VDGE_30777 [Verticillium dahliae]